MNYKEQFLYFQNNPDEIYFDAGATVLKPKCVLDAEYEYNAKIAANAHNNLFENAHKANLILNQVRLKTAKFIGTKNSYEIIFTSGTTHSLNQIAFGLKKIFKPGDEIVLTKLEHSSNLLPWIVIAKELNLKINYLDLNNDGSIDAQKIKSKITKKTKLVSFASISNTLAALNDVKTICQNIKRINKETIVVVDGAQAMIHSFTNVDEWGIDCLAFSAHKMFGPFGLGILWAKKNILELMDPIFYGGGNNSMINFEKYNLAKIPEKFEAGTLNLSAIYAFNACLDFINEIGLNNLIEHAKDLKKYLVLKLNTLDKTKYEFYNLQTTQPIFLFNIKNVHSQDFGAFLNKKYRISVRVGKHCARLSKYVINQETTIRACFSIYNSKKDIDVLIDALKHCDEWIDSII